MSSGSSASRLRKGSRGQYAHLRRPSTAPSDVLPSITIQADAVSSSARGTSSSRKTPTLSDLWDNPGGERYQWPRRLSSSSSASNKPLTTAEPSPLTSSTSYTTDPPQPSPDLTTRPPSAKRPPASRSAHGIETSFGPPPALITRGSFHSELARRAQNPATSTLAAQQHKPYNHGSSIASNSKTSPGNRSSSTTITTTNPQILQKDHSRTDSNGTIRASSHERTADWANIKAKTPSPLSSSSSPFSSSSSDRKMDSLAAVDNQFSPPPGLQRPPSDYSQGQSSSAREKLPSEAAALNSGQSSEDLFLKLAQDNTVEHKQADDAGNLLERRQSRGRRSVQRRSIPIEQDYSSNYRRESSAHDSGYEVKSTGQTAEGATMEMPKPSAPPSMTSITSSRNLPSNNPSEQRFNAYRSRYMASAAPGPTPSVVSRTSDSSNYSHRRPSAPDALFSRQQAYRPSRLHQSSTRDSQHPDRFPSDSRGDGAESVVSTVHSAVWDDMQELKSYVQRVENNKRHTSSGGTGSNGSAERPRTATTTVTTMSSSPKYPMKAAVISSAESTVGGPEAANLHPLLHHSLTRCKIVLNPVLYRSLEKAAADALEMAVWARTTGPQGSIYSSASAMNGVTGDRQLRRRADNLCRNLTDLCVALLEGKHEPPPSNRISSSSFTPRRESRDLHSSLSQTPSDNLSMQYSRHASLEPEPVDQRPTPSRALDRVEARRASLMAYSSPASSPAENAHPTTQRNSIPVSGMGTANTSSRLVSNILRSGTSLLRTRGRRTVSGEDDDDDSSMRAPSRAATEVGLAARKRSSHRLSSGPFVVRPGDREYTSQHPLPPLSVSSSLPQSSSTRRFSGLGGNSESMNTPALLRSNSKRYFERERTPVSSGNEGTPDDEKKLHRRSLGMYNNSGTSLAFTAPPRRSSIIQNN